MAKTKTRMRYCYFLWVQSMVTGLRYLLTQPTRKAYRPNVRNFIAYRRTRAHVLGTALVWLLLLWVDTLRRMEFIVRRDFSCWIIIVIYLPKNKLLRRTSCTSSDSFGLFVKFEKNAMKRQMMERTNKNESVSIVKGMRLPKCRGYENNTAKQKKKNVCVV